MRLRDWLIAGGLMLALVFIGKEALGHEQMGLIQHGLPVRPINCCRYGGNGDCQLVEEKDVKIVEGGYLLADGEFISAACRWCGGSWFGALLLKDAASVPLLFPVVPTVAAEVTIKAFH